MARAESNPKQAEKNGDALIAQEKVKSLSKNGIPINNGTPYSHNSTYGGRFGAFFPQRIKGGSRLIASLIAFIILIILVELVRSLS